MYQDYYVGIISDFGCSISDLFKLFSTLSAINRKEGGRAKPRPRELTGRQCIAADAARRVNSPDLRFAGSPSLSQAIKRVEKRFFSLIFQTKSPLLHFSRYQNVQLVIGVDPLILPIIN